MALATLLPRTQAAGRREKGDAAAMIIDHSSGHDDGVDDKAAAMQLGASAGIRGKGQPEKVGHL